MEERKKAQKDDWEITEMPFFHRKFVLKKHLSEEQKETLRFGHIPAQMEDKWFWYMENDRLYAHRSWTGYCIFILDFSKGGDLIRVTVNRNPKQYSWKNIRSDRKMIEQLLDFWIQKNYDYYHEWISETLNSLHQEK